MARRIWNPLDWLAWYGYASALTWGINIPLPLHHTRPRPGRFWYRRTDLDQELARLLAEEWRQAPRARRRPG